MTANSPLFHHHHHSMYLPYHTIRSIQTPYTISCIKWILHHLKTCSSDLVNYAGLAFSLLSFTNLNLFGFLQLTCFILAMYILCCLRPSLALELHRSTLPNQEGLSKKTAITSVLQAAKLSSFGAHSYCLM